MGRQVIYLLECYNYFSLEVHNFGGCLCSLCLGTFCTILTLSPHPTLSGIRKVPTLLGQAFPKRASVLDRSQSAIIFFPFKYLEFSPNRKLLLDLVSLEIMTFRNGFWQQYPYLQYKGEQHGRLLSTKGKSCQLERICRVKTPGWNRQSHRPLEQLLEASLQLVVRGSREDRANVNLRASGPPYRPLSTVPWLKLTLPTSDVGPLQYWRGGCQEHCTEQ